MPTCRDNWRAKKRRTLRNVQRKAPHVFERMWQGLIAPPVGEHPVEAFGKKMAQRREEKAFEVLFGEKP